MTLATTVHSVQTHDPDNHARKTFFADAAACCQPDAYRYGAVKPNVEP